MTIPTIPDDFLVGGAGLTPKGSGGSLDLTTILQDIKTAVDSLNSGAGTSQSAGTAVANSSTSILKSAGLWRTLAAATLTAARTTTLSATGAAAGDVFVLTRLDLTGFAWTIANGGTGAGTIAVLPGGLKGFVIAQFDGTDWIFKAGGSIPEEIVVGTNLTDTASQTVQRAGRFTWFTWSTTVSADSSVTLGTTGAQKGDIMLITRTNTSSAHTLAVVDGGSGTPTLVTMPNSKKNFAKAYFDGTNWQLMECDVQ